MPLTQFDVSKMDSFIRSKYESRRWAREGPAPSDPSTLEDGSGQTQQQAPPPAAIPPPNVGAPPRATHASSGSGSSLRGQPVTSRQPQPHQLLSTSVANRAVQPTIAPAQVQQPQPQPAQPAAPASAANDLFTLDFHNPTPPANAPPAPKKDMKQDILSLFSTPAAAPQAQAGFAGAQNAFGQFAAAAPVQQGVWGGAQFGGAAQPAQQPQQQPQTSLMGNAGVGMWGASSGWNAAPAQQPQSNLWGAPAQAQAPAAGGTGMFNTNDVWATGGASTGAAGGGADLFGSSALGTAQKKDDAFGDLWGGFK